MAGRFGLDLNISFSALSFSSKTVSVVLNSKLRHRQNRITKYSSYIDKSVMNVSGIVFKTYSMTVINKT